MTRLLPLYVSLAALSLAGCNEKTTEAPEDGRDITPENYPVQTEYSGRVMNGYLEGARVWLDLDGNGLYTGGTIEVELDSGSVAVVEGGEPTVVSGENGRFTLDVSSLQQDVTVAPDLDPQDYRLHALVIPGTTTEQTREGDVTLERAYILSALSGTRNVSPLSTLQAKIRDYGTASGLTDRLAGLNLQDDYIQSDNDRGRTYSSMLTRFMREQLPAEYTNSLRGKDGLDFVVPDDALELLGIALVQNANELLGIVDEAAGGDYANVDVQALELPDLELELDDPQLLTGQTVSLPGGSGSGLETAAEVSFSYGSDARLQVIEADGCMQPSLFEIARLANADGKMAETGVQWLPGVSLSESSVTYLDDEETWAGVDERITFDWAAGTATLDTRTDCHGSNGDAELDDSAEVTYSWEMDEGRVTSITVSNSLTDETSTLVPSYDNEGAILFGYELQENGQAVETFSLTSSDLSACVSEPTGDEGYDPDAANLVTDTRSVGEAAAITDYLRYNTRQADAPQLLQFGLPRSSVTWGIGEASGFNWTFEYISNGEESSGLISSAGLDFNNAVPEAAERGCWDTVSGGGDASVDYSYQSLSEYLTSLND